MKTFIIALLRKFRLLDAARYVKNVVTSVSPSTFRHNREMETFYSQFLKGGDLCFDVGANMGNRTRIFLNLGAHVVAVEPQEECSNNLEKKFGNMNMRLERKALGEKEGKAEMVVSNSSTISSLSKDWISAVSYSGRFKDGVWDRTLVVPVTTLDSLIEKYGQPAFCKIDVEGYEFDVLKGLTKPIRYLSFEFIPEYMETVFSCIKHLSNLGTAEFNFTLGEDMKLILREWVGPSEIQDILTEMPRDGKIFGDVYARISSRSN